MTQYPHIHTDDPWIDEREELDHFNQEAVEERNQQNNEWDE